jgi:Nup85 Nucleoporin
MSGFQVPLSSSPPSTPDRRAQDGTRQFSFGASNPSTTPAGPPPSSAGSFTPAGPPPSSVFGSSRFDSQRDDQPFPSLRFSKETALKPSNQQFSSPGFSPKAAPHARPSRAAHPSSLSNEYKVPSMGRKLGGFSAEFDEEDDAEEQEEDAEDRHDAGDIGEDDYSDEPDHNMDGEEDGYYEDDGNMEDLRFNSSGPGRSSNANNYSTSKQSDLLRRSREDDLMDFKRSIEGPKQGHPKDYMFGRIAKGIYNQMDTPTVKESNDLILSTEELILRPYEEGIKATEDEDALKETLAVIPAELLKLWADYNITTSTHISEEYATAIGPGPRASNFAKANFLASLLLRLHHPGLVNSANSESLRLSLQRSSIPLSLEGKVKQIPLLLLEWMDDYHDPYPSQLDEIQGHRPSPANHRLFWDTILNSLLRGRVVAVVNALKTAGWRHARHAIEDIRDNASQVGYTGVALTNIERVISDAVQVLQQCPAMRGDWNVRGSDWTLFRLRIDQALENLKRFAEGRNRSLDAGASFGNSGSQSYTGTAKKAESQVPWHIYQNLVTMYNLILGDANAVVENSQDWCEATIGLVVWWNPGRDDQRMTLSRSQVFEEETDSDTYLQKLADSFYRATSGSTEFQVNTLDPIEVGLASSFEGDVEAVIGFLRAWSGPVSSAVAEVAALGGWLPRVESQALISMDNLDQDDMDLLGLDPPSKQMDDIKDHTLIIYASALAERGKLESTPSYGHPKTVREGWEIAIEVLGRLDSVSRSEQEVGYLLGDFPLDSGATVNKLLKLLNDLGMTDLAGNIAEVSSIFFTPSSSRFLLTRSRSMPTP